MNNPNLYSPSRCFPSTCFRHPSDPFTGICPSCLRDRLFTLEPSTDPPSFTRCRSVSNPTRNDPSCIEPRRASCDVRGRSSLSDLLGGQDDGLCRVQSSHICDSVNGFSRNVDFGNQVARIGDSVDGFSRNGDSVDGFSRNVDIGYQVGRIGDSVDGFSRDGDFVDGFSRNVDSVDGFSRNGDIGYRVGRIGDSVDGFSRNVRVVGGDEDYGLSGNGYLRNVVNDEENVGGDEVRTMKEFIDLEVRSKDRKVNTLNLFGAASGFSKRVRRWKDKGLSKKKVSEGFDSAKSVQRDNLDRRRRSCDTEAMFSVDAGRVSIDEARASWDGYLVSRTIPSLAPMLYVVENGVLSGGNKFDTHRLSVDGQMQAIMEDESSSGGSGLCNSDSLSSQRWSSFDRSSSVRSKKTVGLDTDEARSVSSVKMSPTKLIITERELKDWQLKSAKDDSSEMLEKECKAIVPMVSGHGLNRAKKAPTWRKMFNILGMKAKPVEKKSDNLRGISVDRLLGEGCVKQWSENQGELKDASGCKTKVGGTLASSRKSFDVASLEQSIRNGVDPKAKPSEKKHDNLKGISVDRLLGDQGEKQWSEYKGKLNNASGCKIKVGGSLASARRSFDVVTLDQSIRNGIDPNDVSGWKLSRSGSVASSRSSIDVSGLNQSIKCGDKVKDASGGRLARSGSVVSSRRSLDISTRSVSERPGVAERRGDDFVLELNGNAKKRLPKVDDEALPFYLMPLRTSKSGRQRS